MFDGEVEFLIGHRVSVPDCPGVYVLYDISGPIYVGRSARSLHKRFLEHYENTHNKGLRAAIANPIGRLRFAWKATESENETVDLEKRWIQQLSPATNVIRYREH